MGKLIELSEERIKQNAQKHHYNEGMRPLHYLDTPLTYDPRTQPVKPFFGWIPLARVFLQPRGQ